MLWSLLLPLLVDATRFGLLVHVDAQRLSAPAATLFSQDLLRMSVSQSVRIRQHHSATMLKLLLLLLVKVAFNSSRCCMLLVLLVLRSRVQCAPHSSTRPALSVSHLGWWQECCNLLAASYVTHVCVCVCGARRQRSAIRPIWWRSSVGVWWAVFKFMVPVRGLELADLRPS